MKKIALLVGVLIGWPVWAQPLEVRPQNFAYQAQITLHNTSPFHHVQLPLEVYQGLQQHPEGGDLRVFNKNAEWVPYSLIYPGMPQVSPVKDIPVPIFPIRIAAPGQANDFSVEVQRRQDGALIALQSSSPRMPKQNAPVVQGAVLDLSQIKEHAQSVRLEVGETSLPFHALTLETSDDLQRWWVLQRDAQWVRMDYNGQRIENTTFEWQGKAGKYIRAVWNDPAQAPAIISAQVGVYAAASPVTRIWSHPLLPVHTQSNTYEYDVQGTMPLEQLRINLPTTNTVMPMEIQHRVSIPRRRGPPEERWETLQKTVVFRLQGPAGDVFSPPVMLNTPAVKRLRLIVDERSGGLGREVPTVSIGFVPQTLVFLSRGEAPFTLVWGAHGVQDSSLAIDTLIPGYRPDTLINALPAQLQPSIKTPQLEAVAYKKEDAQKVFAKGLLWGILVIGVCVLAGMVWKLLKQVKND